MSHGELSHTTLKILRKIRRVTRQGISGNESRREGTYFVIVLIELASSNVVVGEHVIACFYSSNAYIASLAGNKS